MDKDDNINEPSWRNFDIQKWRIHWERALRDQRNRDRYEYRQKYGDDWEFYLQQDKKFNGEFLSVDPAWN